MTSHRISFALSLLLFIAFTQAQQNVYSVLGGASATAPTSTSTPASTANYEFLYFFPANLTVAVGDTITITNNLTRYAVYTVSTQEMDISLVEDRENLTLSDVVTASTNESFTSSGIVMPGRTFNYTFENAGEYIITDVVSNFQMNVTVVSSDPPLTPEEVDTMVNDTLDALMPELETLEVFEVNDTTAVYGQRFTVSDIDVRLASIVPSSLTVPQDEKSITLWIASSFPVIAILTSPDMLSFSNTTYVVMCNESLCLNSTTFSANMTTTLSFDDAFATTGLLPTRPVNVTISFPSLMASDSAFVYVVGFGTWSRLEVTVEDDMPTPQAPPPTTTPEPTYPPTSVPVPSEAPTNAIETVMITLWALFVLLFGLF